MNEPNKTFDLKKRTNWGFTIFLSIWTIGLIGMFCLLVYNISTTPSEIEDLIPVLIFMIVLAFLAINLLRWQLGGHEILIFNENNIEVKNQGVYFSNITKISYSEIENISFDDGMDTPWILRFYGLGGGKIKIEYLGRRRRFGIDLTEDEAENLTKELKTELQRHSRILSE